MHLLLKNGWVSIVVLAFGGYLSQIFPLQQQFQISKKTSNGHLFILEEISTPPKTNMDTQNDGLEKVTPLKHGNCWYPC